MAREWVYKATATIASMANTRNLAIQDGFLAKAAYEQPDENGKQGRADHVKKVMVGDTIHFYFREPETSADEALPIGSFEIVNVSPVPGRFAWPVQDTHLAEVIDPAFESRLRAMGYGRDPKLGVTTGWMLKLLDRQPPKYDRDWFPGNHVLRPYK